MALTDIQQKAAAKKFAKEWDGVGDEKQDTSRFWIELLQKVYGVEDVTNFIRFEQRVKLENTSFIDAMIPATHTLIEQKSLGKDLNAPIKQSDGSFLKPSEQAKRYAAHMPYSERPRWIISCNFSDFQVFDMERPNDEPEHIELKNLGEEYYRLKFMVDTGDSHIKKEMEVSKGAGTLVGRIYNALLPCYGEKPSALDFQNLNKFIVRLVFCFYAEDAGIFGKKNMFHDYMASFNASHFRTGLIELFRVLDQKPEQRDRFMEPDLAAFPYVNGSLFTENVSIPPISDEVRNLILDDGCDFDWSKISPTIFGAIFESTLNPETRRHGGMHYTSIENIHKVIDPLFLDEYKEKFRDAMEERITAKRREKLLALQKELASGLYFDPACGSGNFLTESFLSLRRLENDILRELYADKAGTGVLDFGFEGSSEQAYILVSIKQFYGIEINDFAVSVAKTAMWIAESQMFRETEDIISQQMDFLPLTTNANIHEGNALRMDWKEVLEPSDRVKLEGTPPFLGARIMDKNQKKDLLDMFSNSPGAGNLDYVACWYKCATSYMKGTTIQSAFVSTNSIVQGEQVQPLWENLFMDGLHINFAYKTFIWDNEASQKAHVHCVIIGFSFSESKEKFIFSNGSKLRVNHINAYLRNAPDVFVKNRSTPISNVPVARSGNKPIDDGNYLFTKEEMNAFLKKEPMAEKFFHPWYGSVEFIHRKPRYVLWLGDASPAELRKLPECMKRIIAVKKYRESSKSEGTRRLAQSPTRFHVETIPKSTFLIMPLTSSQRRRYVPIGFMNPDCMASNLVIVVPNATLYHFGVLTSNVFMSWMRVVCGRLKSDYRITKDNVYNNFPWPIVTEAQKAAIEETAQGILDARAKYPDSSLADLYDDVLMPKELREAHRANDRAVMRAYGFSLKMTESECVAELMKMYQLLVEGEKK